MNWTFSLFILTLLSNGVHMHICMWSPKQRGDVDISEPGARPCYRKIGPCGIDNSTATSPRTTLTAGSKYKVQFQQNLNHYYTGEPGSLDVSFAVGLNPAESDFHVLHSFSDYNSMNQITQTNFSIEIDLPNQACDECVLRVRYLSNNPEEDDHGTVFHQCADIKLTQSIRNQFSRSKSIQSNKQVPKQRKDDPHDCCAPESYETAFLHVIPEIDFRSEGIIFYDKQANQMRVIVTVNGGRGNSTYDGTFDMWMNFTSGYQWYYNRNTGACDLYGLDFWNDWCFGNKYNQSEDFVAADVKCSSTLQPASQCNQWKNGEFVFETFATNECQPSSISRPNGERTDYFRGRSGPIPSHVFVPNPVCHRQTKVKHASNGWMRLHL